MPGVIFREPSCLHLAPFTHGGKVSCLCSSPSPVSAERCSSLIFCEPGRSHTYAFFACCCCFVFLWFRCLPVGWHDLFLEFIITYSAARLRFEAAMYKHSQLDWAGRRGGCPGESTSELARLPSRLP